MFIYHLLEKQKIDVCNKIFHPFVKSKGMESAALKNINKILKDATENILEKVLGYIEGIPEGERNEFKLSEEQKESLRKIRQKAYEENTEIETFLNEMSSKYYN